MKADQIEEYTTSLGIVLPKEICEFFAFSNGLNLFSDHLSVYGIRQSYDRTPAHALFLPYDLKTANTWERPQGLSDSDYVLGSYFLEIGSRVVLKEAGLVERIDRYDGLCIYEQWPDFKTWLTSEFDRMEEHFDEEGRQMTIAEDIWPQTQM